MTYAGVGLCYERGYAHFVKYKAQAVLFQSEDCRQFIHSMLKRRRVVRTGILELAIAAVVVVFAATESHSRCCTTSIIHGLQHLQSDSRLLPVQPACARSCTVDESFPARNLR